MAKNLHMKFLNSSPYISFLVFLLFFFFTVKKNQVRSYLCEVHHTLFTGFIPEFTLRWDEYLSLSIKVLFSTV